jgi:6-phosphogluconate dehydrogenase
MEIGLIGLGKMGIGMGSRLVAREHTVVGFDLSTERCEAAESVGISTRDCIPGVVESLHSPKVVLLMVPAGDPVDSAISDLCKVLSAGDLIIDGGNSFYRDSIRRYEELRTKGIGFLDCGVSGGVWGVEEGYCLMVGGEWAHYELVEQAFLDLAQPGGCALVGPAGAGHYAKMVHNGIEYALMQAYGEGFELLKESPFDYDLAGLAGLWNRGSVVRSWLLELAERALVEYPGLENIAGWVEDSGEGRWTCIEAIEEGVPAPVIAISLMMRFRSRQQDSFAARLVASLRQQFGGHCIKKTN